MKFALKIIQDWDNNLSKSSTKLARWLDPNGVGMGKLIPVGAHGLYVGKSSWCIVFFSSRNIKKRTDKNPEKIINSNWPDIETHVFVAKFVCVIKLKKNSASLIVLQVGFDIYVQDRCIQSYNGTRSRQHKWQLFNRPVRSPSPVQYELYLCKV